MTKYGGKITKHGMSGTKTNQTWADMIQRCLNPNNKQYHDYGGRGITVCKRWLTFAYFLDDMGVAPEGMALDRKNNNSGYCKRNCRWATRRQQEGNKRNTLMLTFRGKTQPLMCWARELGINHITLRGRIVLYGWSTRKALTTPVIKRNLVHPRWHSGEFDRNNKPRGSGRQVF